MLPPHEDTSSKASGWASPAPCQAPVLQSVHHRDPDNPVHHLQGPRLKGYTTGIRIFPFTIYREGTLP